MTEPLRWFTSSHSNNGGQCVEVADAQDHILVRDSKDPHGPALAFPASAFAAFIDGIKTGELR
ncbi:DUF397 domain-containing protein [Streptomyces sp. PTM05]|uniref:DUF397 domain-containing protein n=1 Tax=Streptantibioticus parmotrematis TaxID=2873249 RepID=A0ABS7QMI9_9ACTN|nr:DUF397 domain-containing protein [Streptantibioticus parmotrematis]MBY8884148.1 DUF397 domain-containing protein [Streptantibioticus parmotrematis]